MGHYRTACLLPPPIHGDSMDPVYMDTLAIATGIAYAACAA